MRSRMVATACKYANYGTTLDTIGARVVWSIFSHSDFGLFFFAAVASYIPK